MRPQRGRRKRERERVSMKERERERKRKRKSSPLDIYISLQSTIPFMGVRLSRTVAHARTYVHDDLHVTQRCKNRSVLAFSIANSQAISLFYQRLFNGGRELFAIPTG